MNRPKISPELGSPHVSDEVSRGYIEYDPFVRGTTGKVLKTGEHGLIDLRAEIAVTAYDSGMLQNPIIQDILKK